MDTDEVDNVDENDQEVDEVGPRHRYLKRWGGSLRKRGITC